MARLLNKQLHDHVTRDRRPDNRTTAGPEEREGATGVPPDTDEGKSGRAPRLALRAEDQKTGGAGEKAYPAGKRLTPTEVKRSITHAPVCQKSKKPICWDAACHIGCQRADCPHAHEPLLAMNKLDYSVAMQVLRRGGLKNGAKINPKDVDGRVAQLRSQAKEDHDSKVEPGATAQGKAKAKAKAKAKEKAGWAVPDDDQGPVTHLEEELGDLAQGPDLSRHDSFRKDAEPVSSPGSDEEAKVRLKVYEQVKAEGLLDPLVQRPPKVTRFFPPCQFKGSTEARNRGTDSVECGGLRTSPALRGGPELS